MNCKKKAFLANDSKERTLFSGNYSGRGNCGWLALPVVGLHTASPSREWSGYLKCLTVQLLTRCIYVQVHACKYTRTYIIAMKEEIGVA